MTTEQLQTVESLLNEKAMWRTITSIDGVADTVCGVEIPEEAAVRVTGYMRDFANARIAQIDQHLKSI